MANNKQMTNDMKLEILQLRARLPRFYMPFFEAHFPDKPEGLLSENRKGEIRAVLSLRAWDKEIVNQLHKIVELLPDAK